MTTEAPIHRVLTISRLEELMDDGWVVVQGTQRNASDSNSIECFWLQKAERKHAVPQDMVGRAIRKKVIATDGVIDDRGRQVWTLTHR
jgi:hypothetical protein